MATHRAPRAGARADGRPPTAAETAEQTPDCAATGGAYEHVRDFEEPERIGEQDWILVLDRSFDLARRRGRLYAVSAGSWRVEAEYLVGLGDSVSPGSSSDGGGRYFLRGVERSCRDPQAGPEAARREPARYSFSTSRHDGLALQGGAGVPLFAAAPRWRLEWPVGDDSHAVAPDEHLYSLLAEARSVSLLSSPVVHRSFRPAAGPGGHLESCYRERLTSIIERSYGGYVREELDRGCSEGRWSGEGGEEVQGTTGLRARHPWHNTEARFTRRAIERAGPQIRACHDRARQRVPDVRGRVSLSFAITPDGQVDEVRVVENTTGYPPLAECVRQQVERIRLLIEGWDGWRVEGYPVRFGPKHRVAPRFPASPDPRSLDRCPLLAGPDGLTALRARRAELGREMLAALQRLGGGSPEEVYERWEQEAAALDEALGEARQDALEQHLDLASSPPGSGEGPHLHHLAELLFEVDEQDWLRQWEHHEEAFARWEAGELDLAPEVPWFDVRDAVGVYRRLGRHGDRPAEAAFWLGLVYADERSPEFPDRALTRALEGGLEPAARRAEAHILLGDLELTDVVGYDALLVKAGTHYQAALDALGSEAASATGWSAFLYERALYRLATVRSAERRTEEAIPILFELLDRAEAEGRGDEAAEWGADLGYLLWSSTDRASIHKDGHEPGPACCFRSALGVLDARGERSWSREALIELARSFAADGSWEGAPEAYQELQRRYPTDPLGPRFQRRIIALLGSHPTPDPEAIRLARDELVRRYGDGSAWAEAHAQDPETTRTGHEIVAEVAISRAEAQLVAAWDSGAQQDWLTAARLLEAALEQPGTREERARLVWYLGVCWLQAGERERATGIFEELLSFEDPAYASRARAALVEAARTE